MSTITIILCTQHGWVDALSMFYFQPIVAEHKGNYENEGKILIFEIKYKALVKSFYRVWQECQSVWSNKYG
jgi:hypothetical protein